MLHRNIMIIVAVLSLGFSEAIACSCAWRGNFIDYARGSDNVIQARIMGYGIKLSHGDSLYDSMRVEVVAVLDGDLPFKTVELLGDPGFLCRDYVDSRIFIPGKEFIIALHGDEAVQSFGGCGQAWLELDGDVVKGIKETDGGAGVYSMQLDDLLKTIKSE